MSLVVTLTAQKRSLVKSLLTHRKMEEKEAPYHHNTEEPKDLNGDGYLDFLLTSIEMTAWEGEI